MKKAVYLNLAGKNYPLNFSLGACKVIAKQLGGIEKLEDLVSEGLNAETIDKIAMILQVLIAQGCAYKNLFEIDAGISVDVENPALGEDGRFKPLSKEELEMVVGFDDISNVITAINECIYGSAKTDIDTKTPKNENPQAAEEALSTLTSGEESLTFRPENITAFPLENSSTI